MTSQTPHRRGPGRPRDPHADSAILRAAVDLLIERGIDQTSMEGIAKRAGVAKVTVYKRWSTKEDLLADAIEKVRDDLPSVDPEHAASGLPELLETLLPRWGEALADPRYRALSARLLGAGPGHPALLESYWHHHVLPRRERSRVLLREAQAHGVLAPTADIDILLDMMAGAIIHHLLLEPGDPHPEQVTRYLRRLLRQAGLTLPA
ncbi:TetR/AcrR family transcriptional regulator [Marinitenerispora sediminis]|uniref:TetR family transcriptional regulator n=1 Tax=Marinitenerispora sediminis TaxID=1931232 RepID=A0A368T900_9ACTN|nr:TetR/AcrR family transcriptional regulator [Marinitenerispora sediminis]RCV52353.1 TetR family transcriptional regulator [Marinitenerispora sediminis]RCV60918.1 TetR family transcriptional regulator [Marinitenerispora sediminis]RCV62209.1 TetR family transcriptional regulator [Marinitenerispora sediminis]